MKLLHWMRNDPQPRQINKVLLKIILWAANKYPEPTKDNCLHPNSHKLLEIRDLFLQYEDNPSRIELFRAVFKILIVKNEDPYYGRRLDFIIEEIVNSDWKPRPLGYPNLCWKEPKPYGGGYLIKR